jgi:hypothetical protein
MAAYLLIGWLVIRKSQVWVRSSLT